MIIPIQCKAARALLEWKQEDLAKASSVSTGTIKHYEAGRKKSNYRTILALQAALEKAGIKFLGSNGVKLKEE